MWMWNLVRLRSRVLSPAAEAFRHFMIEHGEAYMLAHDSPLLGSAELFQHFAKAWLSTQTAVSHVVI